MRTISALTMAGGVYTNNNSNNNNSNSNNNNRVRGSNSTAAFLHISQNIIAQRIISLFNGRSLRLPKGSPFRNPQKPIQENQKK